jgi:sugar-specific transcriptional regulator TrmB
MQEDLVKELAVFGFSENQAKVYLTILEAGSISVGKIAENSKLYRQDIYKILPKLEKMGVITKTLGTPIIIKSIPIEKALKNLVSTERKRALERIKRMEANLKQVSNAMSMLYETEDDSESEEPEFSLLTKENEITNRADLIFEKVETECNVDISLEILTKRAGKLRERFQNAAKNKAKIRLIIEAPSKNEKIKAAVERVKPNTNNFAAKLLLSKSPKPFHVIDRKEVWISTSKKHRSSGLPCVLWSNGKNIVETYHERFDRLWNSPRATTIILAENPR